MPDFVFDKATHTYSLGGVVLPSVTQVLKAAGLLIFNGELSNGHAMDRGTKIHLACQYYDEGRLDWGSVDDEILPQVLAWVKFNKEVKPIYEQIEKPGVNELLGFAGTPDRVGTIRGLSCIIDIKTGAVSPWVGLQLSGYDVLLGRYSRRIAVELRDNGTYSTREFMNMGSDRNTFLSALAVYKWRENNGN